jgi:Cu-processing system ATP-binding protein
MIQVRGLTKQFGALVAVDNVSFEAAPGEVLALIGPNGSGKTTIMKCIAGLIAPTRGEIVVNGKSAAAQTRLWLSYLPQKVSFPENLTGKEVIGFYSRLRRLDPGLSVRALEMSQLNGFSNRDVREYSAGMLQRLGIAVALMPEAQVVALDEPTAGLDPDATRCFRDSLFAARTRGQTVIISSHALAEVEAVADRIAILVRGHLVACEPIQHFREWVAQHALLRITLTQVPSAVCELVRQSGATSTEMVGRDFVVTARATDRLRILRALEAEGARIERFSTEEPSLETLYLRYTHENAAGHSDGNAADGL